MEVILAKSAGFCYGVARAVAGINKALEDKELACLGPVTHNKYVTQQLTEKGAPVISRIDEAGGRTIAIRAHGIGKKIYEQMEARNQDYIDFTCPDVKKIHNIIESRSKEGDNIIIIGDKEHPEIIGSQGWAVNDVIFIKSLEDANQVNLDNFAKYSVVVQTTYPEEEFEKIVAILQKKAKCLEIHNTICPATDKRQREAAEISQMVDVMIILGDRSSANTSKLYTICAKKCRKSFFLESIYDLQLNILSLGDKIGITAGASTPPEIIKEAVMRMSELDNDVKDQTFEEMLDESFVTLHTGDVVKGTVIQVIGAEVSVNLGYKSDGVIPRAEFSDDPNVNPADTLKAGDEIEVFVIRVNDGEGNVLLSKKRLEIQKGYADIEEAFNNKTSVRGRVSEVVKGGLISMVNGVRVFIPSSQISSRYIENLEQFKGREFDFNILEFDRSKRRVVGGRRDLAIKEEAEKKEKLFEKLEVGLQLEGVVSRIVDFGAFVDIGGADGLIHISEMSWGRVKKVSDVLKEGDQVTVSVLKVDKEKEKISLSLKDVNENPWDHVDEKYPVGVIAEGKVVRMVAFGAFVELEPGVDGLVHISHIARKHVVKPDDELSIGETICVKVVDIDKENKKISLSKKEADMILNPQIDEESVDEEVVAQVQEPVLEKEGNVPAGE